MPPRRHGFGMPGVGLWPHLEGTTTLSHSQGKRKQVEEAWCRPLATPGREDVGLWPHPKSAGNSGYQVSALGHTWKGGCRPLATSCVVGSDRRPLATLTGYNTRCRLLATPGNEDDGWEGRPAPRRDINVGQGSGGDRRRTTKGVGNGETDIVL